MKTNTLKADLNSLAIMRIRCAHKDQLPALLEKEANRKANAFILTEKASLSNFIIDEDTLSSVFETLLFGQDLKSDLTSVRKLYDLDLSDDQLFQLFTDATFSLGVAVSSAFADCKDDLDLRDIDPRSHIERYLVDLKKSIVNTLHCARIPAEFIYTYLTFKSFDKNLKASLDQWAKA